MKETCKRLDAVDARFICIGDGGILESVNPFPAEPRFAELGAKAGSDPSTHSFYFYSAPLQILKKTIYFTEVCSRCSRVALYGYTLVVYQYTT